MDKVIYIDRKINNYKKKIFVDGDKSLSIRWALLASISLGKYKIKNYIEYNNDSYCY